MATNKFIWRQINLFGEVIAKINIRGRHCQSRKLLPNGGAVICIITKGTPPVFELTDPAIHYTQQTDRTDFGRTDLGENGIEHFFQIKLTSARIYVAWFVDNGSTQRMTSFNTKVFVVVPYLSEWF